MEVSEQLQYNGKIWYDAGFNEVLCDHFVNDYYGLYEKDAIVRAIFFQAPEGFFEISTTEPNGTYVLWRRYGTWEWQTVYPALGDLLRPLLEGRRKNVRIDVFLVEERSNGTSK